MLFLLHEVSPSDAKLYDEVLKELKLSGLTRIRDILFDKGYYTYKIYLNKISRYKIVPFIFPKKNFKLNKLEGMLSYPLRVFTSGSESNPSGNLQWL